MNYQWNKRMAMLLAACTFASLGYAQKMINGTVKDQEGEPLIGVNISTNENTGTITDADGNFSLKDVKPTTVLKISYLGYETQEIRVGDHTTFPIQLEPSRESLDEVVVVGYGVMKKRDLLGSISSIKAKDITAVPTTNAIESLQGKVAGLDMTRSSGKVGSGMNFTVHGNRSLMASNAPLILVDGVEYGSDIDINPNEIESMEVLKDASTTAIYGSRGANGVILITTKKGKVGKPTVSFNMYAGPVTQTRMPKVMNTQQNVAFRREAMKAVGQWNGPEDDAKIWDKETLDLIQSGSSIDWLDLIMQDGVTQNYEVSVNGGNEWTKVSLSLDYTNETGLLKGDELNRYSGHLNLSQKVNNHLEVGGSAIFSHRKQQSAPEGVYQSAITYDPYGVLYDEEGNVNIYPFRGSSAADRNLLCNLDDKNYLDETVSNRLFGTAYLDWNIVKGLTFRSNLGIDYSHRRAGMFKGQETTFANSNSGRAFVSKQEYSTYSITWDNTLNYLQNFGRHNVNVLLGQSLIKNDGEETYADGSGIAFNKWQFHNLDGAMYDKHILSQLEDSQMLSYFGRINYSFDNKYMFTFTARADGSSVLAEDHKWNFYPSAALGWRIKEESFLQDVDLVSDAKLRLSYGVSGSAAISPYQTQGQAGQTYYDFNGTPAIGYRPEEMANHELSWESTKVLNLGIDYGMWGNCVHANIDLYRSWTSDLLMPMILAGHQGFTSVVSNVGKTETKGLDITINAQLIDTPDFTWSADFTWSGNKEKIVELSGKQDQIADGWLIGQPTHIFYDYEKIGIWQTDEAAEAAKYGQEPGDIKVRDLNKDGKITPMDDRKVVGQSTPKWTAGWNNHFRYKDFELNINTYARVGQTIRNQANLSFYPSGWRNQFVCDYWTPENPTNAFPRPNFNKAQNNLLYFQTLGYEKGSFVKVKDITLAYNLPTDIASKLSLSRLRVYATMKNYLTFCKQDNYDPERGGAMSYPLTKEMVFGLNVTF